MHDGRGPAALIARQLLARLLSPAKSGSRETRFTAF
jgi:hypothetical protein